MLCSYGCGRPGIYYFKRVNKWCCEKYHQKCPVNRKKYSQPGNKNPMYGKVCSFKGKTKNDCDFINIQSKKMKEHHKNGTMKCYFLNYWKGKHLSEKTKLKIAKKMRGNTYGNGRGNKTIYNDITFKSSWEAKVSKFLDLNNIKWNYEEKEFILSETESYRPDFFIYENNSFVKLIEVKGYFREENKIKFQKFKQKYPEIQVELWNKKVLKSKNII